MAPEIPSGEQQERPARRARQSPVERRKQLVGIGLEMLTRRPLHQVTVDEVAAKAGISRSLLFHYFPTKGDYYAEVLRAAGRRLLRGAFLEPRPGQDALDAVVDNYLAFIERRHEPYIALFRSTGTDDWVREVFLEIREALTDGVLRVAGIDEPTELLRAAVGAWLSFTEELSLEWARQGTGTREQVVLVLRGVLDSAMGLASGGTRDGSG